MFVFLKSGIVWVDKWLGDVDRILGLINGALIIVSETVIANSDADYPGTDLSFSSGTNWNRKFNGVTVTDDKNFISPAISG